MKIAFVHDWFTVNGGAEKVAKSILEALREADIYCLFDFFKEEDRLVILKRKSTYTSFLQYFPFVKKLYRNYLPFYPKAIESFDLSQYDLIISSSFAVAKSVKVKENQIHISYCHSPMRYIWDMKEQYIKDIKSPIKKKFAEKIFNTMSVWDKETSTRVTHFIANSNFIAERIQNCYNRSSTVLHPPVDTDFFTLGDNIKKEDYFIVVSRLVPYKKVKLIAEAFRHLPHEKLIVIGDGPELKELPQLPNTKYLGFVEKVEMKKYLQNSKAVILAAIEDFGISSLEAQACGIPVLALRKGGYLETVIEEKTGLFFDNQQISDIVAIIKKFNQLEEKFDPNEIREHALFFGEKKFIQNFKVEVNNIIKEKNGQHFIE
ncbi:MAG: glycosyltransferase [Vicingus serpentipes]|nr:glycosyltransferase [Vicingus serpentipes]